VFFAAQACLAIALAMAGRAAKMSASVGVGLWLIKISKFRTDEITEKNSGSNVEE
jgi:hypothetical protein